MGYYGGLGATPSAQIGKVANAKTSQILKRLLSGIDTKNVPDIVKRAEALAQKHLGAGGDEGKKAIYKFMYMQARQAIALATTNKYVAKVAAVAMAGSSVAGNVQQMVSTFKSDKPIDASGVADIAGISHQITSTMTGLAVAFGLNTKTAAEIQKWSGIAAGCASSVATMGPYAGGAACALQAAGAVVDLFGGREAQLEGPLAIFTPKDDQALVAATDAARLARVLRYGFKVAQYKYVSQRMVDLSRNIGNRYLEHGGGYPGKDSTKKPITAVDMRSMAAGMCFYLNAPNNVWISGEHPWQTTGHVLYRAGQYKMFGGQGRGFYDRSLESAYTLDYDVNCQTIAGLAHRWHTPWGPTPGDTTDWKPGLAGFVNLNYLLNFFTALSIHEWSTGQRAAIKSYLSPNNLPVHLQSVCDSGDECRYDWEAVDNFQSYGDACWTNLNRCDLGTNECALLIKRLNTGDRCYFREVASIRLMAAFSYMHMVYTWSGGQNDMVRDLPPPSDPAVILAKPVRVIHWPPAKQTSGKAPAGDPLTDWQQVDKMRASLKARGQFVANIRKTAEAAAKQDQTSQVATSVIEQFYTFRRSAAGGVADMKAAIAAGRVDIGTMAEFKRKCAKAGGAYHAAGVDDRHCVPKGTPGAVAIKVDSAGKVTTAGEGGGAGGVVAIAALAAAIALIK